MDHKKFKATYDRITGRIIEALPDWATIEAYPGKGSWPHAIWHVSAKQAPKAWVSVYVNYKENVTVWGEWPDCAHLDDGVRYFAIEDLPFLISLMPILGQMLDIVKEELGNMHV